MRKTTRYLIRQGLKNQDLTIIQSKKIEDVEVFNQLYQATVDKHHFVPFSLNYLKNEFETFLPDNQILTFLARYKNEIIASAIIVFWQKTGFYHHGASSLKHPKIPASYLLQWEAIKEAKKRGCEIYNFWGIAPIFVSKKIGISNFPGREADSPKDCFLISKPSTRAKLNAGLVPHRNEVSGAEQITNFKKKNHPWDGLTLFKTGFGGYPKSYIKTQDLILSQRYWLNYIIEKLRKIKRRV